MKKKFVSKVFCSRRHVDRRRVEDRRLFLKQEYLDHNPERRVNMIDQRIHGGKRRLLPDLKDTFREEDLLFLNERLLGSNI